MQDRVVMAAIGAIAGLVFWAVDRWDEEPIATLSACAVYGVAAAGLTAQFTWTGRHLLRWLGLALGIGALVAAVTAWVWQQLPPEGVAYAGDDSRIYTWSTGALVFLYAVGPFAQIFQRSGELRFPYPELFHHSWNNFFVGSIGLLFLGVFAALIATWGALFELVDIHLFSDVFETDFFRWVVYTAALGYGTGVGRESERVTDTLRRIALSIAQVLLPLAAGIAVLFLLCLPVTGLDALFATGHATAILLSILGFLILFVNAVFEDGRRDPPYSTRLRRLVEAALLAMPIYAVIAFHAIGLRIAQYGQTPQRFFGRLFVVVIGLYTLGYAAAVVARTPTWMSWLRPTNVVLSWVVAGLALAVHTPLLDPLRISAADQFERAVSGGVDLETFDFAYLRFRLGHEGWEQLARLETLESHPQAARLREGAAAAREAKTYWVARSRFGGDLRRDHFQLVPASLPVPDALLERIRNSLVEDTLDQCTSSGECVLFAVDLDGEKPDEVCLIDDDQFYHLYCFHEGERWTDLGMLSHAGTRSRPGRARLLTALRENGPHTRRSWRTLLLAEEPFELRGAPSLVLER